MKATMRYLHSAPRKVRRVADLIRNKSVREATALLQFTKKKPAADIAKLLKSAAANAKNTIGKEADTLVISKITVDQGVAFKRFRTKSLGRAAPIRKKTSHVTIALAERTNGRADGLAPSREAQRKGEAASASERRKGETPFARRVSPSEQSE